MRGANDRNLGAFNRHGQDGPLEFTERDAAGESRRLRGVRRVPNRNLDMALAITKGQAKGVRDFREILADKSIDVVCISTPDHWHAY